MVDQISVLVVAAIGSAVRVAYLAAVNPVFARDIANLRFGAGQPDKAVVEILHVVADLLRRVAAGVDGDEHRLHALAGGAEPLAEVFTEGAASGSTTSAVSPGQTPPDFDDPTALGIGDSLTIDLTASGTADPIGYADAFNAAFGLITIENLSMSDTVEFSFELVVDLMTDASVDDFLLEDALAFAGVDAYSVFFSGLDFIETVEADALFGPPVSSFSNLGTPLAFSLIIDPEDFEDIEIFVEVNGFAEAIPAPGGFVFILAGIALIGVRRQRSRARL